MIRNISRKELELIGNEKTPAGAMIKNLIDFWDNSNEQIKVGLKVYVTGRECLMVYLYDTALNRYRVYDKIYLD